jgi:hypothetical protein
LKESSEANKISMSLTPIVDGKKGEQEILKLNKVSDTVYSFKHYSAAN